MDLGDVRVSMEAKKDSGLSSCEEIRGGTDSQDAGANILMPDIYADEPAAKPVDIKVLSRSTDDDDESVGFDPYDTATLHKK